MHLLFVCDQGNNRSVTLAHLTRYLKHDTLPVGLSTFTPETLDMLYQWADFIICTDDTQVIPEKYREKYRLWDVGPDRFPRPFNPELLALAKKLIADNRGPMGLG